MFETAAVFIFPERPDNRLRLALHRLDTALAEQREAVAQLRAELGLLGGAVASLDRGLDAYRSALDGAAQETARAGTAARRLEATAAAFAQ